MRLFFMCSLQFFFRSQHNQNELNNYVIFICIYLKMWVKPRQLKDHQNYQQLAKKSFFELLKKQKSSGFLSFITNLGSKEEHLITFKTNSLLYPIVVAVGESKDAIDEKWDWIEEKIMPTLSYDEEETDDMAQYLEVKFELLWKDQKEKEEKEKEVQMKKQFFQQQFNLEEDLVTRMLYIHI
jgi:hypothetical protein